MEKELKLKYGFDPKVVVNGFCFSYFASLVEKGWALYAEEKNLFKDTGARVRKGSGQLSDIAEIVFSAISFQLEEVIFIDKGVNTTAIKREDVESFLKTATEFLNLFKEEE